MCKDVGLPGAQQIRRIRSIARQTPHSYNISTILLIMPRNLKESTIGTHTTGSSATQNHEQRDGSDHSTSCPRSDSTVHTASSHTQPFEPEPEEAAPGNRRESEKEFQRNLLQKRCEIRTRCSQNLVDRHKAWRIRERLAGTLSTSAFEPVTDYRQSPHTGSTTASLELEEYPPSIYYLAPQDQADLTNHHSTQIPSSAENTLRQRSTSNESLARKGSDDSDLDGSHDSEDEELVRLCERPWNKAQGTMTGR